MKKIVIIVSAIAILVLAGVLYGSKEKVEEEKPISVEQVYKHQHAVPMPEIILHPMTEALLF